MKRLVVVIVFSLIMVQGFAQRYRVSSSHVQFFSEATIEDITAVNKDISGIWDVKSGEIVLSIPMNKFQFENSLMQEHYNEKYLHTDKYPKAYFKGKVIGNPATSGQLTAEGTINMHGVEKKYQLEGSAVKGSGGYAIKTQFTIRLEDHKIKIPRLMWQNIAEEVKITAELSLQPYE